MVEGLQQESQSVTVQWIGTQLVLMFLRGLVALLGRTPSHGGAGMWDVVLFKLPALMHL